MVHHPAKVEFCKSLLNALNKINLPPGSDNQLLKKVVTVANAMLYAVNNIEYSNIPSRSNLNSTNVSSSVTNVLPDESSSSGSSVSSDTVSTLESSSSLSQPLQEGTPSTTSLSDHKSSKEEEEPEALRNGDGSVASPPPPVTNDPIRMTTDNKPVVITGSMEDGISNRVPPQPLGSHGVVTQSLFFSDSKGNPKEQKPSSPSRVPGKKQ